MKKLILSLGIVFGLFVMVTSVSATTANLLQPASTITYNEELVVNDTGRFDSVYIGKQDEGGVTFFNGTIVNSTTTSTDDDDAAGSPAQADVDNPVTFGDNVRIDGRVYRGATASPEDDGSMPFILNDNVEIAGDLTITGALSADSLSVSHNHDSRYYTETEVDALITSGGHDHIGETWEGSVQGSATSSLLTLSNTGNGFGLVVTSGGNYSAIAGVTSGTSAAVNGTNTGSGSGVTGVSNTGYGVYARSVSGSSLYVDGRFGVNASANKATGSGTITGGDATPACTTITNSLATGNSYILLTVQNSGSNNGDNDNGGVRVTGITSGTSFSVCTMDGRDAQAFGSADTNIPFRYLIIN